MAIARTEVLLQTISVQPGQLNSPVTGSTLVRLLSGMLLTFVRYLRAKLPNDKVLSPWIRQMQSSKVTQRRHETRPDTNERADRRKPDG
jgi:hypothetical protein